MYTVIFTNSREVSEFSNNKTHFYQNYFWTIGRLNLSISVITLMNKKNPVLLSHIHYSTVDFFTCPNFGG